MIMMGKSIRQIWVKVLGCVHNRHFIPHQCIRLTCLHLRITHLSESFFDNFFSFLHKISESARHKHTDFTLLLGSSSLLMWMWSNNMGLLLKCLVNWDHWKQTKEIKMGYGSAFKNISVKSLQVTESIL